MTITFEQTGRDVVTGAMRDLGVLGLDENATDAELDYGLNQLNLLLKGLAAEGVNAWTDEEAVVDFAAGEGVAVLDPRPVDVLEARVQISGTYDRPLTEWTSGEWDMLPNKSQRGTPLVYQVLRSVSDVRLRVWPVPTADTAIAYSYARVVEDATANAALDVPQMWGDAIQAMLAARLTAFMPGGIPQTFLMRAEMLKRQLLDFDRPDSYFIEPYDHG